MATNYPAALDNFTNPTSTQTLDQPGAGGHAGQHTDINDAVEAVEGELGTTPKGSSATVKERIAGFKSASGCSADLVTVVGADVGIDSAAPGAKLEVQVKVTSKKGLRIKLAASQTAVAMEIVNSADAVLAQIDKDGGAIFNEQGAAVNFRVEGDTDQNLLFLDGTNDRVGIGTSSPSAGYKMHVASSGASGASMLVAGNFVVGGTITIAGGSPGSGKVVVDTNGAGVGGWRTLQLDIPHTWAIAGEIKVPSGDTDFICPFFVPVPSGQSATIVRARHIINSGTNAVCKLQKNGSDATGFTGMTVTTTAAEATGSVAVADGDKIALVVTAVNGTPKNLSLSVMVRYNPANA